MAIGWTPMWQIIANGTDVTANFNDRLVKLTVVDTEGNNSDTCDIEVDDRDGILELPDKGSKVSIAMGYKETGLAFMGLYTVDEIKLHGYATQAGRKMWIKGKSADMRQRMKEHRHKGHENKSISDIVKEIASRHSLNAAIGSDVGAFQYDYIAQQGESDLHFLTRLARSHDAIAKVAGGNLIFVARGDGASASGLTLPVAYITPDLVNHYSLTYKDRPAHKKTRTHWWDHDKAKMQSEDSDDAVEDEEEDGESEPEATFGNRHHAPNQAQAKSLSNSRQAQNDKDTGQLEMQVIGDTDLKAEIQIVVQGVRAMVDNTWRIKTATHTISGEGYLTILSTEKPKKGQGKSKGKKSQ